MSYSSTLEFDRSALRCRAAVLRLDNGLREHHGLNLPSIRLPSSAEDARALQARRFADLLAANQTSDLLCTARSHPNACPLGLARPSIKLFEDSFCHAELDILASYQSIRCLHNSLTIWDVFLT